MVSNICTRLLKKEWRLYELDRVPHLEGIYIIGITGRNKSDSYDETNVLYVGRTNDVHRRLGEHTRQNLKIDEFVKNQFEKNKGRDLRVKRIEEKNDDHTEKEYIDCIAKKLGYWPEYNIRR